LPLLSLSSLPQQKGKPHSISLHPHPYNRMGFSMLNFRVSLMCILSDWLFMSESKKELLNKGIDVGKFFSAQCFWQPPRLNCSFSLVFLSSTVNLLPSFIFLRSSFKKN
jgi:hypothetical protein